MFLKRRSRLRTFRSRPLPRRQRIELMRRHDGVPGFEANDYPHAHVCIVGANGLGFPTAAGLVKKGVRQLTIIDFDHVEMTNLNRTSYRLEDLGKNKAFALGRILANQALMPLTVRSYALYWQEFVEVVPQIPCFDALICAVDNNPTRRAMTAWALKQRIPIIHAAVGRDANAAYAFCQVPGGACWGCAFPEYLNDDTFPCAVPAIVDVLSIASGFVLAAADSLITARVRQWNLRHVFVDGALPDRTQFVERRVDCPICAPSIELQCASLKGEPS